MPFDLGKFQSAEFRPRTQRVPVPALAAFFPEGEEAVWEVRGLTASEINRAMEAQARQDQLQTVVTAIASAGDAADVIRKALGLSNDTPAEIVKRIEMLHMGSVQPVITQEIAVKLGETCPIEFLALTAAITELTGKGFDLVKPPAASQQTTTSTPA